MFEEFYQGVADAVGEPVLADGLVEDVVECVRLADGFGGVIHSDLVQDFIDLDFGPFLLGQKRLQPAGDGDILEGLISSEILG